MIKISGLEDIANILFQQHDALARKRVDVSMIPEDKKEEVFQLAISIATKKNDDEAVRDILYYRRDWDTLFNMAKEKIANDDPEIKSFGFETLSYLLYKNQRVPTDFVVQLVEFELKDKSDEEIEWYRFIDPLRLVDATEKAKELGNRLLAQGNFEDGMRFMSIANYTPTKNELKKYSKAALKNGLIQDAISFYQFQTVDLTPNQARKILAAARVHENQAIGTSVVDTVFNYMEEMPVGLDPSDYKEQGDIYFTRKSERDKYSALEYYLKAGDTMTPEEFKDRGESILLSNVDKSENLYELAFDYLKIYDEKEAIMTMERTAANLASRDSQSVTEIYKFLNKPVPVTVALVAAKTAFENKLYVDAARFYVAANKPDKVSELGNVLLSLVNKEEYDYNNGTLIRKAISCFKLVNDEDALLKAEFYSKNYGD